MERETLFSYLDSRDVISAKTRTLGDLDRLSTKMTLKEFKEGGYNTTVPMSLGSEFLCIFLLFLWPGCLLWIWFPLIYFFLNFTYTLTSFAILSVLLYATFGPLIHHSQIPLYPWMHSIKIKIANMACEYFSFKVIWEESLQPEQHAYILVAPPHGVFPFGNILTLVFWDMHANFHFSGAAASILFYIPIMRQVMTWIGCIKANASDIKHELLSGRSVGLSSGGIAELFASTKDQETIIIRNRKGFIRLAMETNAKIVPCYLFGNTQALHCLSDSGGIMQTISRKIQASITFFWGRFGLPIAYRTPILAVMGRPINVTYHKDDPIPTEEINQNHADFVTKLEELFDRHKAAYGWANKKLNVR